VRIQRIGLALAAGVVLLLVHSNASAQAGNVANGKKIFAAQKCDGCHGPMGEGGAGDVAGPQIGPPRLALPMFVDFVRNPKDPMPSFTAKDVSDAQLADVYAFLKSLAPAQAAPTSTAASGTGSVENGRKLYTEVGCYECHDRDAAGAGTGPRLAPNPLAWTAFSRQVRNPVNSMPPYTTKVLSDAQLQDIYAFLGTIPKPPATSSIPLLQQ
jgi:mono/diheme cytochrome c family protein